MIYLCQNLNIYKVVYFYEIIRIKKNLNDINLESFDWLQ